ncbi:MAG: hypothetical protein M1292_11540 [Bacteroidetes bacterium]|nr:hypothetical protein [Bacteroidota bacterium]
MIRVKNSIIPFKGFKAITLWPFIFFREEMNAVDWNHETIHGRQQIELLFVGFYLIYFVEWIFKGYDRISFEKEAYANQDNQDYLKGRKVFAMWKNK